jgi:hypothetical protein
MITTNTTTSVEIQSIRDYLQCSLELSDGNTFVIPMRKDGYIFATKLCQVANKRINNWLRRNETNDLLQRLEKSRDPHAPNSACEISECDTPRASLFIEVYKGATSTHTKGTWIHPDLGINLAQWCSPSFGLQVSKWVKELIITRKVEIGQEKSDQEVTDAYDRLVEEMKEKDQALEEKDQALEAHQIQYKQLENRHQQVLQKRVRHTYKKGACFYLMGNAYDESFSKPGFTNNLSERQVYYLTASPCTFKILYACYSPHAKLVEDFIKAKYADNREINREGLYKVSGTDVVASVREFLGQLGTGNYEEIGDYAEQFGHLMNRVDETFESSRDNLRIKKTLDNIVQDTKECARCKEVLDKDKFGVDSRRTDGKSCYCKVCKCDLAKESKARAKMNIVEKSCRKCGVVKPVEDFNRHVASRDGRHSYCKECFRTAKAKSSEAIRDVSCPHCDLMYKNKDSLGVHLRRKH